MIKRLLALLFGKPRTPRRPLRFRPVCYVLVGKGEVATTVPVQDGRAYADFDRAGRLLGVEFTCTVEVLRTSDLVEITPDP